MSNNQSATKTKLKTTCEKFIWKIDNFSEQQEKCGEYFKSSEFTSTAPNGKHLKWQFRMYPNGLTQLSKDYVDISLGLLEPNNEEVRAKYQISIRKSDGEHSLRSFEKGYSYFETSDYWDDYNKLIKREDLLNEENDYLDGDRLTIVFKLMVHPELQDIEVPESQAWDDMSHLYEKGLFTDCKVTSEDDKEYQLLCERKLINSIEIANACRLLVLANRYSAKHLKETAINFIKINGNEVMASKGWKELADAEVMEQILKAVMGKQI